MCKSFISHRPYKVGNEPDLVHGPQFANPFFKPLIYCLLPIHSASGEVMINYTMTFFLSSVGRTTSQMAGMTIFLI